MTSLEYFESKMGLKNAATFTFSNEPRLQKKNTLK